MTSETDPSTDAAGDDWAGARAERWVRMADGLERELAPVLDVLLEALAPSPGEKVLDVGCGTGPTTRAIAAAVGPDGSVTGADISADMLAAAAQRTAPGAGAGPIEWLRADMQTWAGPAKTFDAVTSRFGVMFFDDVEAAFANLARVTRPGGRLVAAVWGHREESPLFDVPLAAALDALAALGVWVDVPAPDWGPFGLADRPRTQQMLLRAGWRRDVAIEARRLPLAFAGGLPPAEAARACLEFGPTRPVAADLAPNEREAVVASITDALEDHVDDAGHVVLDGTLLLLSGRTPG